MGTLKNGLFLLDADSGEFKQYTEKNGLAYNEVVNIQEDHEGHLWLGTSRGLSRFDPETEVFVNFNEEHGFHDSDFLGQYFKDSHGNLYYGNTQGMTVFHPDGLSPDTTQAKVVLTDIHIFDQSLNPSDKEGPLRQSIALAEEIRLEYHQGPREQIALQMFYRDEADSSRYCSKNRGFNLVPSSAFSN